MSNTGFCWVRLKEWEVLEIHFDFIRKEKKLWNTSIFIHRFSSIRNGSIEAVRKHENEDPDGESKSLR